MSGPPARPPGLAPRPFPELSCAVADTSGNRLPYRKSTPLSTGKCLVARYPRVKPPPGEPLELFELPPCAFM
jgi:hypothetical protein